jgi:hypothetical protein
MNKPSIKDSKPNRDNLGPKGPAKMPPQDQASYEDKHPNPGNVTPKVDKTVGPTPTDDPRHKAGKLVDELEKHGEDAKDS